MKKNLFILTLISFMFIACSENNGVEKTNNCDLTCKTWQACDQVTNTCVLKSGFCNENSDCAEGDLTVCDTVNHTCKKKDLINDCDSSCQDWEECNEATNICDLGDGFCNQDSECTEGYLTICDTVSHTCKEEEIINDCNSSCQTWETCNETTNACDLSDGFCNENSQCTEDNLTVCDTITHVCKVAGAYVPPIGIPAPTFGIDEKHTMYEGLLFEEGSFTYKDAGNGPYSHYIDNESADCSDSDNLYGDVVKPRCSIPNILAAGSVVELHGKDYTKRAVGKNQYIIESLGTKEKPVFVRGISNEVKTSFIVRVKVIGDYMIFENLYMDKSGFDIPYNQNGVTAHASNISVRNCELEGSGEVGHGAAISVRTINHDDLVENIVLYKNHIHHYGKHNHTTENDYHGIGVGANAKHIFVLNNHVHHNGGDSIQVNFYSSLPDLLPQYIYIGKNEMHDDAENAVDLKGCRDVIVSQNNFYNYDGFAGTENKGVPIVTHYGSPSSNIAKRVWFIFNEIHDSLGAASAVTSGPDEVYFVSNKIYNIKNSANTGTAFLSWSSKNQFIVNNTIVNSDIGMNYSGGDSTVSIENNIFSNLSTAKYIKLDDSSYTNRAIINNNVFYHESLTPEIDGNDENSIFTSPDFVNLSLLDLNLNTSSPAYETGLLSTVIQKFNDDYNIDINKYFNGEEKNTVFNIGAF